jgi:hypothetical protein
MLFSFLNTESLKKPDASWKSKKRENRDKEILCKLLSNFVKSVDFRNFEKFRVSNFEVLDFGNIKFLEKNFVNLKLRSLLTVELISYRAYI